MLGAFCKYTYLIRSHVFKYVHTGYQNKYIHKFAVYSTNIMANEAKKVRSDTPVIGTHNGTFHCDEVLACFMLKQLPEYENARIFRSRNDKDLLEKCDIIVDVGGIFDHERKLYDHHQKSFNETLSSLRPELGDQYRIRLSSAGLVYTFYGERVIDAILRRIKNIELSPDDLRLTYIQIYNNFISEIDAIDNGVPMFEHKEADNPVYKIHTNISARIGRFNPGWDEESVDIEKRFYKAMEAAGEEFIEKVLFVGASWIKARQFVREALLEAKTVHESGEILILKRFCPWKVHLFELEKEYNIEGVIKLVLFMDSNVWRVAGVPRTPDSFLGRKFLPVPWRGLRDEELSSVAGVPDLIFTHHSGFIGGAKTKDAALAMAIKSLEWPEEENV